MYGMSFGDIYHRGCKNKKKRLFIQKKLICAFQKGRKEKSDDWA